ncbi:uncharacterized protein LOC132937315 [Metopolophium dirhodum]|uniref:uncharacterized protein LOC132937315 n=1 Tax=Metopolophium dirhodum TaxID=44670 RepID=UPI00298F5F6F|nr:uncharacterized protein LOC132937315 [Metopolophium dirhodum]
MLNLLVLILIIQPIMATNLTENYRIKEIESPSGIFFNHLTKIKTTNSKWKLSVYVNLTTYDGNFERIKKFQKETIKHCLKIAKNTEIVPIEHLVIWSYLCEQFNTTTTSYIHDIEKTRQQINYAVSRNERYRRGLINGIGRLSKTLFGICSDEDYEFFDKKISEISEKQIRVIHDMRQQTRIVQSTVHDVDRAMVKIQQTETAIISNINKLESKANQVGKLINEMEVRQIMNEQTEELNVLLTQHSFQTHNLVAIVNTAQVGHMHSSIISATDFLAELQQVRIQLDSRENFAEQVTIQNVHKLMKMSNLQVIRVADTLIFIIAIPIVDTREYRLYKSIPLPIKQKKSVYALIQPTNKYLAMSEDNVYSIYIDDIELSKCIHMQEYYICSNTQTHYIQETDNCEAKLFSSQDKDVIPKACEIKITRIQKLVIHKLDNENVWLYTAEQPTTINIDCASGEPVLQTLQNTGTISLTYPCRAITKEYELTPTRSIVTKTSYDFIPRVNITANMKQYQTNRIQDDFPKINNSYYPDFHSLANNAKQLDLLLQSQIDDSIEYVTVSNITYVTVGIGIGILVLIIVISKISFKLYKQNKVSMSYIKALVNTKSVDDIQCVEIK